jgi:tRNA(adenine34) deaminase
MNLSINDHMWFMAMALEQAEIAYRSQEVPVGAIIISRDGEVLSRQFNLKETNFNPTGHAEILSIIEASKKIGNWRLNECSLYVTLEPCPMCLAAMVQARIGRCVFGAYDPKGGAIGLGYGFHRDKRLNHQFALVGGVKHFECSKIISQFFRERRAAYRLA